MRFAFILLLFLTGCQTAPRITLNPPQPTYQPAGDLPVSLRPYNWTDSFGSGSCVNASSVYVFRGVNLEELADWWRRTYAGGETDSSIRKKYDAASIKYGYTRSGEPAFLDWCSRTRRRAIIWYYTRHCVTFLGFAPDANGVMCAWINDNNKPTRHIPIERNEFLRRWRDEFGGFALAPLNAPVPQPLWPRFTESMHN